jgi:hypothetical protein
MPFIRKKRREKPQKPQQPKSKYNQPQQQPQSKYARATHPYQMSESYKMYGDGGEVQGPNWSNLGTTGAANLASSAGSFVGNLTNLFLAPGQIKKQKAEQEAAMGDIDQFFAKEKKGLYDTKLNQSLADAYSFGVRATDTSGAQAAAQTALGAASADPRVAAGMINQIQSNLGGQMLGAAQADAAKEQQQMLGLGQVKQQLGAEATMFDKQLGLQKLGEDKLAYNTAKQNEEAIRAARRAIPGQMVEDGINVGIGLKNAGVFAQGGQMTPGEFNHETNPIHMVDDNGNKVGEATGGEFILNPEQSDTIEDAYEKIEDKRKSNKEITQDDLMYLYEAVRSIFSQPQFNDQD